MPAADGKSLTTAQQQRPATPEQRTEPTSAEDRIQDLEVLAAQNNDKDDWKVLGDLNTDPDNQEVVGDMKGELLELMQVRPKKIFERS